MLIFHSVKRLRKHLPLIQQAKQIVSMLNYLPHLEDVWGRADTVSRSLNLGTGWCSRITFTPCPPASGKSKNSAETVSILQPERRQWRRKHIRSSSEVNPRFPGNHVRDLNPTMMSYTDYIHERSKWTLLLNEPRHQNIVSGWRYDPKRIPIYRMAQTSLDTPQYICCL